MKTLPLPPALLALTLTFTLTSPGIVPPLLAQTPASTPTQTASPAELTHLRTQYEKDLTAQVSTPWETALTDLNQKFITALDRAADDAKKAGLLELVLAIHEDKNRLSSKAPIPDDLPATPDAIKKLRTIYRTQLEKITTQRAKNLAALLPAHTTKLQSLEVTLTKSDRIQDAKSVRDYRLSLATPAPAPNTPQTAAAPETPKPTDPPNGSKTTLPTGDDRLAAEWLLSLGAWIRIEQKGKTSSPETVAELPKSPFFLAGASLKGSKLTGKITAADLLRFKNLKGLKSFDASEIKELTDADFAVLSTCPSLTYVGFGRGIALTDATMLHLAENPNIREIGGTSLHQVTGTFLSAWKKQTNLTDFTYLGSGINDEGISHLPRFPKIQTITLETCPAVTDASLPAFAKLPKLTALHIQGTSITAPALAAAKLKITALDCNWLNKQPLRETAPIIGPAYPDVRYLRLTRSESLTAADLAALVHFKGLRVLTLININDRSALTALAQVPQLTSLTIDRKPFTDADIPHLLALPQLTSLHLFGSDLTDNGLLQLATHPTLKKLEITNSKTTPAGLAGLKKIRPDLKIEN